MNINEQSDFRAIFGPLWARKWLIVLVAVLTTVGTYLYYDRQPRVYSASTKIYLGKVSSDQILNPQLGSGADDRGLANQAELIGSRRMGTLVARRLKSKAPPEAFTSLISATPVTGTDFIRISATAADPNFAARLANVFAEVYIQSTVDDRRRQLRAAVAQARAQIERLSGSDRETIRQRQSLRRQADELLALLALAEPTAEQIDRAVPIGVALSPRPRRDAIFGFFVGLIAASALAFVLSRLEQRKLRSVDDVERLFGVPLLTVLPRVKHPRAELDPTTPPPESLREPLRRLDTTLSLLEPSTNGNAPQRKVILVTSAEAGDGKSTLVRNLALIQQEAGKDVVVLDSDFRAPIQERLLNVQRAPGLSDVLASTTALAAALQVAETPVATVDRDNPDYELDGRRNGHRGVSVLAAGRPTPNPPALMSGPRLGEVLEEVRGGFDQVLIDTPPPLAVSDVLPLLSKVDGILLVCRIDHTSTRAIDRLLELLERLPNAPVLGVVANDVPLENFQGYGYTP